MTTHLPEALRLADWLLDWLGNNVEPADLEAVCVKAAAELRRLHEEVQCEENRFTDLWDQFCKLEAANQELLEVLKILREEFVCTVNGEWGKGVGVDWLPNGVDAIITKHSKENT